MSRIRCFVIVGTDQERRYLRRFTFGKDERPESKCPGRYGHDASVQIEDGPCRDERYNGWGDIAHPENQLRQDQRWPAKCAHCGYEFRADDEWQPRGERLYRREDGTGDVFPLDQAPPGALWRLTWYEDIKHWCGFDGQSWACMTPGGEWHIDSQANNCTKPGDETHRCWVRTGTAPDLTAGKDGPTCSAGAGSIQCGEYHGFLRAGYLED